jgi:predicted TIM-barrel fold metal-dependent hydrolase
MYDRLKGRYAHAIARGYDAPSQLEAMDIEGIDVAVLFPTRGLYALANDRLEPQLAAAIARAYNDWLADFCSPDPQRLIGAAMVSPHNVEAAVAETRRRVQEHGFKAIFLRPNIVGAQLHDAYHDPPAVPSARYVGFGEGGEVDQLQVGAHFTTMLRHTCTHPMAMMLAVVDIIGGGVLERFPTLRVAFLRATSWAPFLLWRLTNTTNGVANGTARTCV